MLRDELYSNRFIAPGGIVVVASELSYQEESEVQVEDEINVFCRVQGAGALEGPAAREPNGWSRGRRGNCFDNAPIESFWGTLKSELVYHRRYATREGVRRAISEYIEIFYNRQRTQARLDYLSPAAFTQRYYLNQVAA